MESKSVGFGGDVENPKWEEAGRVHDWRNYAGDTLRRIWPSFTIEQKYAVALSLQDAADNEYWD